MGEQFWGRAARASNDSKESGRLLIFWANSLVTSCSKSRASALIFSRPLSFAQNVTLHSLLDFLLTGCRL